MDESIADRGFGLKAFIALCLSLLIFTGSVRGDDLVGSEKPEFQAAINTWLEDNDADSLPAFAALAAKGNIAARLLLARIEDTDRAPGEFVGNLSRKDRVALFRSSGKGLFRPSWLKAEANAGNRTAAVLLSASALEVNIEAIEELYRLGEVEAAYDLIRQVAGNGSEPEKAELAQFLPQDSELAPYLLASRSGINPGLTALSITIAGEENVDPEPDPDAVAAAEFVEWGYQTGFQAIDFDSENRYYATLSAWLGSAASMAPIANLCARVCARQDADACAVTAFGLVGGYYKAIRFDSPLEALIDQSRYLSSERATGMLLRRISSVKNASGSGALVSIDELGKESACLADAVRLHTGS